MFEIKKLPKDAVPSALKRAEHYRLLNEPAQAESICRDILAVDEANEKARQVLILAMTDEFGTDYAHKTGEVREQVSHLKDEYSRAYFSALISERKARATLKSGAPGAGYIAFDLFKDAMKKYEQSERGNRADGSDDPVLRWNACARTIMHHGLEEAPRDEVEPYFD